MSSNLFSIVLVHIGGERRSVPVEHVANTYVSVRWGQSGIYDLNLAKNVLTARSQKAQRKGKAHWKAEDIQAVRKMVSDYRKAKEGTSKVELTESIAKHETSMPYQDMNPPQKFDSVHCIDPNTCVYNGSCVEIAHGMQVEGNDE